MEYDVVVATRNRPDVLSLSIPSFLRQRVKPRRLIVVDASDDHEPVRSVVTDVTDDEGDVEVIVLHTAPGLTAQRNVALQHVNAEIVMFPDDDALWYDDAVEHVLGVYARDTEKRIGGVSFSEVLTPPPGTLDETEVPSHGSLTAKLMYRIGPIRERIEDRITPNPMHVCGLELMEGQRVPDWLDEHACTPVPYMLGFRMTFRTESIRRRGFDETLQAYGLYEDNDASLSVLHDKLLVLARKARVYHHRAPGARAGGRRTGVILLLNLCYITCKHAPFGSRARKALRPYGWMRTLQYLVRAHTSFGRQRLKGVRCARRQIGRLMEASPEQLAERYRDVLRHCLEDGSAGSRG